MTLRDAGPVEIANETYWRSYWYGDKAVTDYLMTEMENAAASGNDTVLNNCVLALSSYSCDDELAVNRATKMFDNATSNIKCKILRALRQMSPRSALIEAMAREASLSTDREVKAIGMELLNHRKSSFAVAP